MTPSLKPHVAKFAAAALTLQLAAGAYAALPMLVRFASATGTTAPTTWQNPRGTATATFSGGTMVTSSIDAQGNTRTDVWQQQHNPSGTTGWQVGTIAPTATTTVHNTVNAGSANNANVNQGGGCGGGTNNANVGQTANTGVNNTVNASATTNTQIFQQQQNAPGAVGFQKANVWPTANVWVNNTINASSWNTANTWQR